MSLSKILKNTFLVVIFGLVVTACTTTTTTKKTAVGKYTKIESESEAQVEAQVEVQKIEAQMQGDVYVGTDTVGELSKGVPDRVFFATNESILTTISRDTLRKQAAWLRENSNANVVVEGHADERGTREYNLALGERRANAAKDYLMTYGVSADRISVISYGKERPVDSGSNPLSWSKNRRSVTVKAN